jgi:hypothetical protein
MSEGGEVSCLVTALFYDSDDMERAIEALIARGIPPGDLSLMVSRATARKYFAPGSPAYVNEGDGADGPLATLAAKLVTAASGSTNILAAGPLMAALAARGTDAFIGGISAGLCSLGIAEDEAALCEHSVRNGDALLLGVTTSKDRPEGIKAYLKWFDVAGARNSLASTN